MSSLMMSSKETKECLQSVGLHLGVTIYVFLNCRRSWSERRALKLFTDVNVVKCRCSHCYLENNSWNKLELRRMNRMKTIHFILLFHYFLFKDQDYKRQKGEMWLKISSSCLDWCQPRCTVLKQGSVSDFLGLVSNLCSGDDLFVVTPPLYFLTKTDCLKPTMRACNRVCNGVQAAVVWHIHSWIYFEKKKLFSYGFGSSLL